MLSLSARRFAAPEIVPMIIGGKKVPSKATEHYDVFNAATGECIAKTPLCSVQELDVAVQNSKEAFKSWKSVPPSVRARVMHKFEGAIRDSTDELAKIITLEQGKTIADAKGDIFRGLEVVEIACNIPGMAMGETLPNVATNVDTYSYRLPLGVCAGITPFNFPAMIPLWMFPFACTTGNTFVLKPSERVPLTSIRIAELAHDCGMPPGVLNVVHGTHEIVNGLCDHPDIRALSFVGSNAAGEHIYKRATANGKRAQCNMGAKNHAVVLPDADPQNVINTLAGASVGAAGQRCMATSVAVFVGKSADLIPQVAETAAKLKVGPGSDSATEIGPLISKASKERIEGLIQSGVDQGANLLLDGRNPSMPDQYKNGYFVGPTVFSGVKKGMKIYDEEIFGPVLCCVAVDTLEDALEFVNSNAWGNGSAIFTRSGSAARKYVDEVEAGQVGVNLPIPVPLPMFSFTGNKKSILGDLNFYGKAGMQFYTQWKTVTAAWRPENFQQTLQTSMPVMK